MKAVKEPILYLESFKRRSPSGGIRSLEEGNDSLTIFPEQGANSWDQ